MRVLASPLLWFGNRRAFHGIEGPAANLGSCEARLVYADRFFDLCADADDGVERCHRLLKNHRNLAAAQRTHFLFAHRDELHSIAICARTAMRAAMQPCLAITARSWRLKAHQRKRQHRFARAGFADNSQRLAFCDCERNVIYGANPARARR